MSTPSLTTSIIQNPRLLWWLRLGWWALALTAVVMFVVSLPAEFQIFRDSPEWAVGFQAALDQINISRDAFAIYITALDLLVVIESVGLALIVFYLRSNSRVALYVSLIMIVYGTSLTLAFYLTAPVLAEVVRILLPVIIVGMLMTYPDGSFYPRWTRPIFIGLCFIGIFESVLFALGIIDFLYLASIGYPIGVIALLNRYRSPSNSLVERQQIKWLLWGFLAAFFAVTSFEFAPILFPTPSYSLAHLVVFTITNSLRLFSALIFVGAIEVSIVRYRLWDIDLTINRSLVYGIVTIILLAIFALGSLLLTAVLRESNVAVMVAAVGAATLFNPTRKRIQNIIDKRFYGFRFDMNELKEARQKPKIKNSGALSGRQLGTYEVLDVIGKGGMGEVYAGQGNNNQRVAIKILPDELAQQEEFRKRFEREAQALAQLNHPNIIKIYETGTANDISYMAIEFIDGQDLSGFIKQREKLDLNDANRILADCAAALDHAHQRGFVHRDIKPSNIMVRENGEAILMDFGIAKMQNARTALTNTGAMGTIDYMAPEQIMAAKEVDHRADIYALGVVLYEMLTGERPFGGNVGQVLFAHLQQPPPNPRDLVETIPFEVVYAIKKAMEKNPEDRFQSAGEFVESLKVKV